MNLASFRPIWPALTLLASGALLAGAHAFETFGGLTPCLLCLKQREFHWGVVGVSVAALIIVRFWPALSRWAVVAIGLALLGAGAMALYHVAVEQHLLVAQCDVGAIDPGSLSFENLGEDIHPPNCDEIAWQMFGISMAGYNAIISLLLALATFAVALARGERK
ncbi:MAG: disulfide bond formation protein B [Hyphomonadaceae bacterium]